MRDHYDVGVVGCWYWGNYGSLLNGYATFFILQSMGLKPLNIVTPYNGFEPHAQAFLNYVYKQDDLSDTLPFERLGEYNAICDSFLTGSDQLWYYDPEIDNRRFERYFKLDFADRGKKKVSFATSFGGKYVQEPDAILAKNKELFDSYSAISVRENDSVDILRRKYGIEATLILEPVFDIPRDVWDGLAEHSEYSENEPYLLTYILDPTEEKRKAISYYAEKLGLRCMNILDGMSQFYEQNKEKLNLPGILPNITAIDLLKYFQGASFVITDSFHGVCFSLIYNKPFIAVQNIWRGVERFKSLLSDVKMRDRLVSDKEIPLDEKFLNPIDFTETNQFIESERKRAVKWLENAMRTPKEDLPDIRVKTKTSVSVLGSNTSRDIFRMNPGVCVVDRSVSQCSPISMVLSKPDRGHYATTAEVSKAGVLDPDSRKIIALDCNKEVFDDLSQKKSDYLVLDMMDIALDIEAFREGRVAISRSPDVRNNIERFQGLFGNDSVTIHANDLFEGDIEEYLSLFIDNVLKIYSPQQIIFHDLSCAYDLVGNDGKIRRFIKMQDDVWNTNRLVALANAVVKERIPECHIIRMPDNCIADENHTQGVNPRNFVPMYYDYAARAIEIIVNRLPLEDEKRELAKLYDEYHDKFGEMRARYGDTRMHSSKQLKNASRVRECAPQKVKHHINLYLPEEKCMGCGACVSACPVGAIRYDTDQYGLYKAKVNETKCVGCGKCERVCAALELPRNLNTSNPPAYSFITGDKKELMSCASGGAGTVFARTVVGMGGVAVGAAWEEDFRVRHIFAENAEDLERLKKSKYFQSYLGDTFKRVKEILESGRMVLFTGTPCQVAGLRKFLGRPYPNLILVDLLCANCPSAAFFKKYLSENFELSEVQSYGFRHKMENDALQTADHSKLTRKNGQAQLLRKEDDDYLTVYHTCSLAVAKHCLTCQYQGTTRMGDLTIGDCWGIQNYDTKIDASKGVSVILINNEKGQRFLDSVPKEYIGVLREQPLGMIKKYNVVAFTENRNWPNTLRRRVFHEEILKGTFHDAKEKAMAVPKGEM